MEAIPGSDLEKKCIERAERKPNRLDALCLDYDECPQCVDLARQSERYWDGIISMWGCSYADDNGNCADDCPCEDRVADSPYQGQVRNVATSE